LDWRPWSGTFCHTGVERPNRRVVIRPFWPVTRKHFLFGCRKFFFLFKFHPSLPSHINLTHHLPPKNTSITFFTPHNHPTWVKRRLTSTCMTPLASHLFLNIADSFLQRRHRPRRFRKVHHYWTSYLQVRWYRQANHREGVSLFIIQ
jgi:hypothetical protein